MNESEEKHIGEFIAHELSKELIPISNKEEPKSVWKLEVNGKDNKCSFTTNIAVHDKPGNDKGGVSLHTLHKEFELPCNDNKEEFASVFKETVEQVLRKEGFLEEGQRPNWSMNWT